MIKTLIFMASGILQGHRFPDKTLFYSHSDHGPSWNEWLSCVGYKSERLTKSNMRLHNRAHTELAVDFNWMQSLQNDGTCYLFRQTQATPQIHNNISDRTTSIMGLPVGSIIATLWEWAGWRLGHIPARCKGFSPQICHLFHFFITWWDSIQCLIDVSHLPYYMW